MPRGFHVRVQPSTRRLLPCSGVRRVTCPRIVEAGCHSTLQGKACVKKPDPPGPSRGQACQGRESGSLALPRDPPRFPGPPPHAWHGAGPQLLLQTPTRSAPLCPGSLCFATSNEALGESRCLIATFLLWKTLRGRHEKAPVVFKHFSAQMPGKTYPRGVKPGIPQIRARPQVSRAGSSQAATNSTSMKDTAGMQKLGPATLPPISPPKTIPF